MALGLAWGLGAVTAQAAVDLRVSVDPGTASQFVVPTSNNNLLQVTIKNVGTTALSISPRTLSFTLQFPPHVVPSTYTLGTIACNYISGDARSTGVLVNCPTTISTLNPGSTTVSLYIMPDASSVGVSGTIKAAIDPSGLGSQVDASTCTATGAPSSGCYVGALAAPSYLGYHIANMLIGPPSSATVGTPATVSIDMYPTLLGGGVTSITRSGSLPFHVQLPPGYTFVSMAATPGRRNYAAGLTPQCAQQGGDVATGLIYSCVSSQSGINVTYGNSSPSQYVGWTLTVMPNALKGGRFITTYPAYPGGSSSTGGFNADPEMALCVANSTNFPLGCTLGPAVAGGPSLSLSTASPASLAVGASSDYPILVSNTGTGATGTSVVVYDKLPPNVLFNSAQATSAGSVVPTAANCSVSGSLSTGQLLTCTLSLPSGGIPGGGSASFSVSVTPQAAAVGVSSVNRAALDPSGGNAQPAPGDCTGTDTPYAGCAVSSAVTVSSGTTLRLSKSSPSWLVSGVAAPYGLVISNTGTGASGTSLVLYDQLPPNFVYTSVSNATPNGGVAFSAASCVNYAGSLATGWLLQCNLSLPTGGLPPGSSAGITLTATPQAAASGVSSTNRAAIDATGANAVQSPANCTGNDAPVAGCAVSPALVPDQAVAAQSTLAIGPAGPLVANGVSAYTLTATAQNGAGAVVTGIASTFSFSAPGAGAALSASTCTTATTGGSAGTCSVTLTATTAGSYAITASLGGSNVGGTNPVLGAFTAGLAAAGGSRVAISSGPKIANGSDAYTITVTAYDANGNLNTGNPSTFSFSAPGAGAALSASTCTTATTGGNAGTCSVTLTATTAGSYSVTASLGGSNLGGTNPVVGVFSAGPVTAGGSRLTISSGPKTANGVDAYTLTATTNDANGNLNTSSATSFSFSAPGAGAALSANTCTTATSGGSAGTCSVTLTATTAGSYSVTASLGGTAVGGTNPVTAVFVAGAPTASASRVTISAGPKTANGVDAYTLTASALDALGNLNTSSATSFSFSAPGAGAALSANTCTTVAGICSVSLTATAAGSYSVTASLGGTAVGGTNPVVASFEPGEPVAASSRVTISAGPKLANGVDAYTITASAIDPQGNLGNTTPTTFNFSAPAAGASLSASSCVSAASGPTAGTCSVTLTATVAGSYAVTASLGGTAVGGTNPVTAVFVAGAPTASASRVTISAGPKTANGVDAYTITVSALDANGNLNTSQPQSFSFSAPGAGAALSANTCTTATSGGSAGTCSVTLTATTAGSYSVTASLGGTAVGGSNPVTAVFVAGPVTAAASRVTISAGPKTANGVDAYTLTASAMDAQGNLNTSSATSFSFSAPGAGAALSANTCTTATSGGSAGTCSVTLTATTAGSYSVTASLGGTAVGGSNPVTAVFVAGAPAAAASRLSLSAGPLPANGSSAFTLSVTALDANGNLSAATATTFSFSAPAAGANLSASSCTTLTSGPGAGTCSVSLTATLAGSYSITASLGGSAIGGTNPATAVFVSGSPVAAASRLDIDPGPHLANGSDAYTLTLTALDSQGNLSAGNATTFSLDLPVPGTGSVLGAGTCTTATSGPQAGRCSVPLTATVAGQYSVRARLDGLPVGGSNPAQALFVAGPAVASGSRLDISTGPRLANGIDAYTLTASARDAQGNLNTSVATAFSFSLSGAGNLSAATCITATSGPDAGTCSVTLSSRVAGSPAVTASLGGTPVGGTNPVSAVFVAASPTPASARVSLSPGPLVADGVQAYTLTVSALDADGNLNTAAGISVSFSDPAAGASLSASYCTTATTGPSAGTCSVSLKASVAGSYAITARLGGVLLGGSNPVVAVFVPGNVTAAGSRLSIDPPGPLTADNLSAYTLTVRAQDELGNLNAGSAKTFSFSDPGPGASLSASQCTTPLSGADAGTCSVTLRATQATVYSVSASLGGVALGGSNPVSARFVAGEAFASTAQASIDAGPRLANGLDNYTLTASATDAFGNIDSSKAYTFSFSVTGAGAALDAASCTTATSGAQAGRCSVGLHSVVSGVFPVSVSLGGQALGGTNPLLASFVAGPVSGGTARVVMSTGPRIANGTDAYTLMAQALDAQGNLNTSAGVTFSFSAPVAGASLSASTCTTATSGASAGTCSVSLTATVAGSYTLTASVGGSALLQGNPLSALFVAGAASAAASSLDIDAGPKTADGLDAYTISATVRDALGNPVTASASTISFSVSAGGAQLSASTCTTATSGAQAGRCSVTLSATVAGRYTVSARLGGEALLIGNPVQAEFVAGQATAASSRITLSPVGPKAANGVDAYTITVSALDAYGNLVTGATQTFSFTAPGQGALLSASTCATTTGRCSVEITATVAGTYAVGASLSGTPVDGGRQVNAVFQAGAVSAAVSKALISQGPKIADGVDAYTLSAVALDALGNAVTLNTSTFSFSVDGAPNAASLSAPNCVTPVSGADAGRCSVTLVSTGIGLFTVNVRLDGVGLGNPIEHSPLSAVFVAGSATASASRVAISAGPKTANGVDAYTITASALDAQGNLNTSSATSFSFSAPGAGAALSANTCTTATSGASAGTCSVTLTATVAGSYAIMATTGGVPVGGVNPVTAVFVAGTPTASASRVTISAGPKLANGVDAYTLTVSALDANGNLTTGSATPFSFSAPGAGASLSANTCTTTTSGASAGTCSVTLTATTAGSYAIAASLGGMAVGGSNPVSAVFVAGSATASASRVAISAGPKTANGVDAYTITASALDAQGNLNTSQSQSFSFSGPGAGAALSANTCTTVTGGASAGTCSVTLTATVAGSYAITATTGGVPVGGGNPVTAVFVAGSATASASRVTISAGPKLANGVDAYTIRVMGYDAQGNLSSFNGTTFRFSAPGAGASLSALECVTALSGVDAGICSVTLTATVAGSYTITADLAGAPLGGSNPVTAVFVASGVDAGRSRVSITLSGATRMANGVDAYTITATAYDAQGNLNTVQPRTFEFSWREGGAVRSLEQRARKALLGAKLANQWTALSANTCSSATSGAQAGSCSVTLKSTRAGWFTVITQVDGVPVGNPAGGEVAALFVAGPASAAHSVVTISPGVRQADGVDSHTVTITARDAFDNVQAEVSTLFTFSPPGAGASLSATSCSTATAGANAGSCSVTLRATVPGAYTVVAGLNNQPAGNPVQAQFGANAAPAVSPVPTLGEWACVVLVLSVGGLAAASGGVNRQPKGRRSLQGRSTPI